MSDSYSASSSNEFKYVLKRKDKSYIDLSLSFEPSPVTNDITILTNERAINNSLKNIVMFLPSEVPFDHNVGSNVTRYLFDIVDDATAALLSQEITRAILFCEPRVTFEPSSAEYMNDNEAIDIDAGVSYNNSTRYDLGVQVSIVPDKNEFDVRVAYRIVGGEKIFRFATILTPTR